ENKDWAAGFDVVIHNECFAKTTDADYIQKITSAHREGTDAVVIHCAMHTYRDTDIDDWREFLGVTSRRHGPKGEYAVTVTSADHPVMREFPSSYVTQRDELYIIEKTWPSTTVLATSTDGKSDVAHPVFWTNRYGDARVFGTTFGHSNETFSDQVYLSTLVRGILWSAGRLD
ncbi:MAG: ThuA domain-containing protein, partial [Planctomycetota bacterium]